MGVFSKVTIVTLTLLISSAAFAKNLYLKAGAVDIAQENSLMAMDAGSDQLFTKTIFIVQFKT